METGNVLLLRKPDVIRYTNMNHLSFHNDLKSLFREYEEIIDIPLMASHYQQTILEEQSVSVWQRRSDFAEKKREIDYSRNKIYRSIMSILRLNLKNFDPVLIEHAKSVYRLLDNYGNVAILDYDGKTTAVENIIPQLRSSKYIDSVSALNLLPCINEWDRLNTHFKTLANEMIRKNSQKPKLNMKQSRRITDEALRQITNYISAKIKLHDPEPFADFVGRFNVIVNHYNILVRERYGRIHAKTDLSESIIDTEVIFPQPFTGKPVFVIPSVFLRATNSGGIEKKTELIFTKDFTITCKNNINIGTAQLIIQGVGKYTGKVIRTFNIITNNP
jgi:hypothetical protein